MAIFTPHWVCGQKLWWRGLRNYWCYCLHNWPDELIHFGMRRRESGEQQAVMAWQRAQGWHGMHISHMFSLKRIGPDWFRSIYATVWQHYSACNEQMASVLNQGRDTEPKHRRGDGVAGFPVCECAVHMGNPAAAIVERSTPGLRVTLCRSQKMLPENGGQKKRGKGKGLMWPHKLCTAKQKNK